MQSGANPWSLSNAAIISEKRFGNPPEAPNALIRVGVGWQAISAAHTVSMYVSERELIGLILAVDWLVLEAASDREKAPVIRFDQRDSC